LQDRRLILSLARLRLRVIAARNNALADGARVLEHLADK
jgi:hypothetical protein